TSGGPGSGPGTPTGSGTPPSGQLVVTLAPLSTGGVTVLIGGTEAGSCTRSATSCNYAVQPGQQVTLDPDDVVLSWGGTPCTSTAGGDCTFTAAATNEANPLVMRLLL
ncbi:MAG TPA: hypothetical protein VMU51_23845, partial [Mycobacteriales bacterium]|nr:hypothetical protein [Mycobacteriales bacterium]